jgi:agmatine/peptidylarginine deiminase
MFDLPLVRVPLTIEGGNLLSNGEGIAVLSDKILEDNIAFGLAETTLVEIMKYLYGFKQIVMLESLYGEETGHVDMFAAFTSPDAIVVGAYDPKCDEQNAAILDRNAAKLSEVKINSNKPLRVDRIPMPPHSDNLWRTYTNVLFANGVVLVPVYPSLDHVGRQKALAVFSKLLPNWEIVGIDASRIIESNGALHCIAMNLGFMGKPTFLKPSEKPIDIAAKKRVEYSGRLQRFFSGIFNLFHPAEAFESYTISIRSD